MAYIKKKDQIISSIEEEIKKNGVKTTYYGMTAIKWDKWPICIKDVCVDNIFLVDYIEGESVEKKIVGCNMYDNEMTCIRVVNDLSQKIIEGIFVDMTEGYKKKKKEELA